MHAASEPRNASVEPDVVRPKRMEQRHIGVDIDAIDLAVHFQFRSSHEGTFPLEGALRPIGRRVVARPLQPFDRGCSKFKHSPSLRIVKLCFVPNYFDGNANYFYAR